MRNPGNAGPRNKTAYSLHRGRSRTPLVTVVRDEQSTLYRILWPDIGVSPPANLTRCKAAARDWAERSFLTDHRKMSGARRLKSLNKFWWSASPIEKSRPKDVRDDPGPQRHQNRTLHRALRSRRSRPQSTSNYAVGNYQP